MSTIHLDIVSPEGELFSGEVNMVIVPATQGDLGVSPRHAPLLTTLRAGRIRVLRDGQAEKTVDILGGMVEIQPNHVSVFASSTGKDTADPIASLRRASL